MGYVVMVNDPSLEMSILLTFKHLCFQSVELWQTAENGDIDISVKLYAKKETHMVSALCSFLLIYSSGKYEACVLNVNCKSAEETLYVLLLI